MKIMPSQRIPTCGTAALLLVGFILTALLFPIDSVTAGIYKYQREDGTWAFTDDPSLAPDKAAAQAEGGAIPGNDLAEWLQKQKSPANILEKTALATVVITSSVGKGSGFFISAGGHIITNKHVIRSTELQEERREAVYDEVDDRIKNHRRALRKEQAMLNRKRKELKNARKEMHPNAYLAQEAYYQQWQTDINRRKSRLRNAVNDYHRQQSSYENDIGVRDMDQHFTIMLADKSEHNVYLVAISADHDLALLKLDGYVTPHLSAATGGVQAGVPVYAIGNPVSLHNSISGGILSGWENDFLKTDAKIYPGNSGGPLVTEEGGVIGVNTFKKLTHNFEGLGFAIPIETVFSEFSTHL